MSARDLFLYFGDFLSDFFCSPASGYVIAFAGLALIGFAVFDFIYTYYKAMQNFSANREKRKGGK